MHLCSTWPESVLQKHKLYTYLSQTHACTHKHWPWARLSQLVAPGVRLCCEDARRLCFFCRQPKCCLLLESRSLIKQFTNCLFSNNAKVISLEWEQKLPPCRTDAYKANSVGGKGRGEVGRGGGCKSEDFSATGNLMLQEEERCWWWAWRRRENLPLKLLFHVRGGKGRVGGVGVGAAWRI